MTKKGIAREMSKLQVKIDGIGAKFIFLDDFSQTTSENTKINAEAINEWLNKERQKLFEASGITLPPNDYFIDIANHYNISREECLRRIFGCFGVRPIRKESGNV